MGGRDGGHGSRSRWTSDLPVPNKLFGLLRSTASHDLRSLHELSVLFEERLQIA